MPETLLKPIKVHPKPNNGNPAAVLTRRRGAESDAINFDGFPTFRQRERQAGGGGGGSQKKKQETNTHTHTHTHTHTQRDSNNHRLISSALRTRRGGIGLFRLSASNPRRIRRFLSIAELLRRLGLRPTDSISIAIGF